MEKKNFLDIYSHGIPFTVRVVYQGDKYGLNYCKTHEQENPLVEFYDGRYPHTEYGQFVSRYYLSTLLEGDRNSGLTLDGGIADWYIASKEMAIIKKWAEELPVKEVLDTLQENLPQEKKNNKVKI